jgi:hypothetical protein
MKKILACLLFSLSLFIMGAALAAPIVPTDIQQPGTQPGEIGNLESPNKCDNCHGGYNTTVEPAHNWRGSMMSHAGRDPIFWATVAIAEQDFDGAGDLCIRCHSTTGWLGGRSTPTDGSGLAASDSDGVDCDFCHKVTNPDNSEHIGTMNAPFIANESGPNNDPLFDWDPPYTGIEGYFGSGMASMWGGSDKLGPYAENDAAARHQRMGSKFHRDRDFCGTCHDVSNPAVGDLAHNHGAQVPLPGGTFNGTPNVLDPEQDVSTKAAFNNPPYAYGIVERTFSEYKAGQISQTLVDDFPSLPADLKGGALQAIYESATAARGTANYEDGDLRYYSCQTCHMRAITGKGANKNGVPVRTDLPLHDMTGGNYWMPEAIAYLNNEGKLRLGGGMSSSLITSMLDGALRAKEQLNLAASLSITGNGNTVKVVNHTGHKLISGYPEGRRMWLNIKWYASNGGLIREDGKYGEIGVTVNGVNVKSLIDLHDPNTKVYEAHMGMTQEWAAQLVALGYDRNLALSYDRNSDVVSFTLGELADQPSGTAHETFHFVLNNTVVKDNRIPPYGMSYDLAQIRNALPVPANQYGGGTSGGSYNYFDEVALSPPAGAQSATIDLMYQPTSWEYIHFLDLANNTPAGDFLTDEGKNMLEAWLNTGMAEPYVMASITWGTPPVVCEAPTPDMLNTTPGDSHVLTEWQEIPASPITIDGYRLFYDQAGKAQLIVDLAWAEELGSYDDQGLTNGEEYCYKLTTYKCAMDGAFDPVNCCESAFSNILCATPVQPGQQVTIPDVVGLSQTDAEAAIIAAYLVVGTVDTTYSDTIPAGTVISQEPAGGTLVPRGAAVNLVVSLGAAPDCSQYNGNESACRSDSTCRWHRKTQTCLNK